MHGRGSRRHRHLPYSSRSKAHHWAQQRWPIRRCGIYGYRRALRSKIARGEPYRCRESNSWGIEVILQCGAENRASALTPGVPRPVSSLFSVFHFLALQARLRDCQRCFEPPAQGFAPPPPRFHPSSFDACPSPDLAPNMSKKHFHLFSGDLIEIAAVVACELCKGREIIYDCPM